MLWNIFFFINNVIKNRRKYFIICSFILLEFDNLIYGYSRVFVYIKVIVGVEVIVYI